MSMYQPLSENFIRKYAKNVNWFAIILHQKVTNNFVKYTQKCLHHKCKAIVQNSDHE